MIQRSVSLRLTHRARLRGEVASQRHDCRWAGTASLFEIGVGHDRRVARVHVGSHRLFEFDARDLEGRFYVRVGPAVADGTGLCEAASSDPVVVP